MFCEKCGKQLNDNAAFCGNCGNPVQKVTEDSKIDSEKKTKRGILPLIIAGAVIAIVVLICITVSLTEQSGDKRNEDMVADTNIKTNADTNTNTNTNDNDNDVNAVSGQENSDASGFASLEELKACLQNETLYSVNQVKNMHILSKWWLAEEGLLGELDREQAMEYVLDENPTKAAEIICKTIEDEKMEGADYYPEGN